MPARKLKEFLDSNKVKYVAITHSPGYTAQEIAAAAHVPGQELAKTVIVKIDGRLAMAVLPAPERVDFEAIRAATDAAKVELATENEFKSHFPECEPGAMPPMGNLYDMPVFVAESLTHDDQIAFNAGSHTELIRLAYEDFARLVRPKVLEFAGA